MFHSVEHALTMAFAIGGYPIEPKNATQLICEALEERFGCRRPRMPSGLSPHDWHAQAVMTLTLARRTLGDGQLWQMVLAEYATSPEGGAAIKYVTDLVRPGAEDGADRMVGYGLTMRVLRRQPRLRDLSDEYDISPPRLARLERALGRKLAPLRQQAIDRLHLAMEEAGLLALETA